MNTQGRPLTLRVNFSWTLIGNGIYAACQWAMLTAIARIGTPEMVGQFALGLAISAPVIMFANLQLRAVLATDARREIHFRAYLVLRLATAILSMVVIAGIALAGGYRAEVRWVLLLVGLAKSTEAVSDIFYGRLQSYEHMDMVSRRVILKGLLGLTFLVGFLILTKNIIFGVLGLVLADIISLLGYDIRGSHMLDDHGTGKWKPAWREALTSKSLETIKRLISTALPLGVVMMFVSLNLNIPRYFLESHLGERDLGIFAALAYLIVAGSMVTSALGQSALPRLAILFEGRDYRAFRILLRKMLAVGAGLGVLSLMMALVFGNPLLTLIYGRDYASHSDLLNWLMFVGGIQYLASFLGYGMTAARQFKPQLPLFGIVTAVCLLLSSILIPNGGLTGAAFALMGGGLAQLIGSAFIIFRVLRNSESHSGGPY